jgi:hypothetical protein
MPFTAENRNVQGPHGDFNVVTLSSTAQRIVLPKRTRCSVVVRNTGSNTAYVGSNPSVTTSTGFLIYPDEQLDLSDYMGELWGVASPSTTVNWAEIS